MYMIHLLPADDSFGETLLFGKTLEEIRASDTYKSWIDEDHYKEQACFNLTLIDGDENLPDELYKV